MRAWLERSVQYADCHKNGHKQFGNHGICVDNGKYYFSYFGSDVVIVDPDKKCIEINDYGYITGTTPQTISGILYAFANEDYDIINNGCREYNNWYNEQRYKVFVFDSDIRRYSGKYDIEVSPICDTIEIVPKDETPKEFREKYMNKFRSSDNIRVSTKLPVSIRTKQKYYSGMCYIIHDNKFNHTGSILFSPITRRLRRRKFIKHI